MAAASPGNDGYHVNTQLPKILSAARLCELTGDKRYEPAVRYSWDRVVNTPSMAPGGVDLREPVYEAGEESARLAWNSSETCSVYNMLKLTRSVVSWNPSVATIYSHHDDTRWVNLLIPSLLDWPEKGVRVRMDTVFSAGQTVMLTIMYGPVVLAGELGTRGMPDDVSPNQSAHSGAMDPPVPVLLVDTGKDPSSWVKRVSGESLRFKTVGAGKPNDVTVIPGLDSQYFEGNRDKFPDFSKLEVPTYPAGGGNWNSIPRSMLYRPKQD